MLLDFTNPVLDPRITFSRGTNATLVDSTGKIAYAPANLLLQSQTIATAPWSGDTSGGSIPTATNDAGIAPDGTNTATRLQINRGAGIYSRWQQTGAAGPTGFYLSSVWMRTTSGTGTANVGLRNDATGVNCVVTGTWQRFSVINATAINFSNIQILSFTSIPGTDVSADILVWGAQSEPVTYQTTPGPYVATTASPYYGPRFDYDPVTLAPRGLLIEEARTNILTYSAEFDNAAWVKQNATVTANATASPDGTTNADTVVSNTTSGRHTIDNTVAGAAAGATYTVSIYVKKGTQRYCIFGDAGDSLWRLITFDFDTQTITGTTNVTSSSATAAGNGWFRLIVTATRAVIGNYQIFVGFSNASTNTLPPTYVGSTSDTFYAYGSQLEAGAFATSYIPTVASTVSRSADVATMTGTNFSSWYNQAAGTFVMDGDTAKPTTLVATAQILSASDGTVNNNHRVRFITAGIDAVTSVGGVTQVDMTEVGYAVNVPSRVAYGYLLNDYGFTVNGGTVQTDTSATVPTVNSLQLGSDPTGFGQINGHIRAIAYYNTRLPNTQLQTLTAPSLASPLALDFISPTYTVGY
jgi:hypothetical protein